MYHSSLGRWMQPDPTWPQDDISTYGYLHNNPVNLLDPMGLAVLLQGSKPPRPIKEEGGDERGYQNDTDCDYYINTGYAFIRQSSLLEYCRKNKVQCCDKQIKTMDQFCALVDDLLMKKTKVCRLTIAGHGCAPLGVWLDPDPKKDEVFAEDNISDDCAKKIKMLLGQEGILRLCGCANIQPVDKVKEQLKQLHEKLGVVVCACAGESWFLPQIGCGCKGTWVCYPPRG